MRRSISLISLLPSPSRLLPCCCCCVADGVIKVVAEGGIEVEVEVEVEKKVEDELGAAGANVAVGD